MHALEGQVVAIEARAEPYAFGVDDGTFAGDLQRVFPRVKGRGWTFADSRVLDPVGEDPAREAAWWLAGRGLTPCALHLPLIDAASGALPVTQAILARSGGRGTSLFEGAPSTRLQGIPREILEGQLDLLVLDAAGGRVLLIQTVSSEVLQADSEIIFDYLSKPALFALCFLTDRLSQLTSLEVDPALYVPSPSEQPFEPKKRWVAVEIHRSPDGDWEALSNDPLEFVRLRPLSSPPGSDGPDPSQMSFVGLPSIPPCRGVLVGACLLQLLDAQRAAPHRLAGIPPDELYDQAKNALHIDHPTLASRLPELVGQSRYLNKMKLLNETHIYLSSKGIFRAAYLLCRLGGEITADETLRLLDAYQTSIYVTVQRIQQEGMRARHTRDFQSPLSRWR